MRLPLRTDGDGLLRLLHDLNGWQNISVRSLDDNLYDVVLTTKQVKFLGEKNIKGKYGHE